MYVNVTDEAKSFHARNLNNVREIRGNHIFFCFATRYVIFRIPVTVHVICTYI